MADLSSIIGGIVTDLGAAYIQNRWGTGGATSGPGPAMVSGYMQPTQTYMGSQQNVGMMTGILGTDLAGATAGVPEALLIAQQMCGGTISYKKVCGAYKWVLSRKRRRKLLVTQSDVLGLVQLQAAGIKGQQLSAWIAKRG